MGDEEDWNDEDWDDEPEDEEEPVEPVSPQAFLDDIADRARKLWGSVWQDHGQQWLTWRADPTVQRHTGGFERLHHPYPVQETIDRIQRRWEPALSTMPNTPRFVGVMTRQPELPERVLPLAEAVRGELARRGTPFAKWTLPEIAQLPEMAFGDQGLRFNRFPSRVRKNLAALADELLA